jgi:ATP synthase protein I
VSRFLATRSGEKVLKKQERGREKHRSSEARNIGLAMTIPTTLAATIIVGTAIGYYLDKWLGTGPWLLLLFLFLGIGAGIRETIRLIRKLDKDS